MFFPGSTIGNFEPFEAVTFLSRFRRLAGPAGLLLLGADGTRERDVLVRAYDDEQGVTAAFNKNVLLRMNSELGAEFDLDSFTHRAKWNPRHSRVEMHVVSRRPQRIRFTRLGLTVAFRRGESIWTENSYKFDARSLAALGRDVGWRVEKRWVDRRDGFALTLYGAATGPSSDERPVGP